MRNRNRSKFKEVLLENSESNNIKEAFKEWFLFDEYEVDEYGDETCICGHPIKEVEVIKNKFNNKELKVGNVCVLKFWDKDEAVYLDTLELMKQKRMKNTIDNCLNVWNLMLHLKKAVVKSIDDIIKQLGYLRDHEYLSTEEHSLLYKKFVTHKWTHISDDQLTKIESIFKKF